MDGILYIDRENKKEMFKDIATFCMERLEEVIEVLPKLIVYEFGKALGFVENTENKDTKTNTNFGDKLKEQLSEEDLRKVKETFGVDVETVKRKSKKL